MNMEPSSPAETCNGRKRKNIDSTAHEHIKRLKTEPEDEELPEYEPSSSSSSSSSSVRLCVQPDRLQQPITLNELTELLHYAALGKTGGIKQPSWCRLRHQRRIKGVNVVIVDGLSQSHFYKHYLTMRHLRTNYTTRVTFNPPSTNLASEIFSREVPEMKAPHSQTHNENNQLEKALRNHPVITKFGTQRKGLTAYVYTEEEMIKRHFPVKGMPGFEDFFCTDSVDSVTDSSPLYGLDCEMCLTVKGFELTRVSLVNSEGKCLLDVLVKPENRILNYLTKFSGITAAMLRPINTSLREVQLKLRSLLPSDAVLVGHSLNNDLMALKLIHRHVIDTSTLYRKEFGQRFKLKVLAETVLKRRIQTEETTGHNPIEDAAAALELAQYFIKTGPRQVVELHMEQLWGYTVEEESADCAPEPAPAPKPSLRFADVLQTLGRSVSYLGKRGDVALDLSQQQWLNSDKELLESFRRQTKCPFFSVLQLSSVSDLMKKWIPHVEQQNQRVCAGLRDMCVVFAGPFPAGFSEGEARRLFRCCGPVRRVKILSGAVRVHAEVEFELLEGATLALKTLNGLNMQGQSIKVQRPVNESTLDLDLTLEALPDDGRDTNRLYVVKLKPGVAECLPRSAKVNGHTLDAKCSGEAPFKVNGERLHSKLSEETVRETFSRFGEVERVFLPGKKGQHAFIKFQSPESKHAALSSSRALRKENYLVCPAMTPPHLASWVAMTTPATSTDPELERTHVHSSQQEQETHFTLRRLDRRLHRLFRCLPGDTLSVVALLGPDSTHGRLPGLCLMEVKEGSG